MSEQQSETRTTTAAPVAAPSACLHPEAVGTRWGDPISPERQAELQGYLDEWEMKTGHDERKGPFDWNSCKATLTGVDVFWLAEQSGRSVLGRVPRMHLENANLNNAHLEGANLSEAHLEDAHLYEAHLECAYLHRTHLEHAYLREAHLEGANLTLAHLERAILTRAHLEQTTLRGTWFDKYSHLKDTILTVASLDQVSFDQTNLTVVDWSLVTTLGDEQIARARKDNDGKPKDRTTRLDEYKSAVRANRVLAVALRNQGMNEDADRFAYRAQFLQQQVLRRQRKIGSYLFSRLLDGLAGYGYKPVRGLIAYLIVIVGFAFAYGLAAHGVLTFGLAPSSIQPLQWYEALVLSISSFHGRGFFQPVQSLGDPVAIIAAAEAILGLLIEISFIATFTQRFFGR
jgi:Pentapeptide repeats (8 copies)